MEWKEYKLGTLCTKVCSGGTPKSTINEYYGGEIPWLNTKEVDFCRIYTTENKITQLGLDNSSAKWIDADCVIVAMYGATAGKVAINKIPLTTNQACCNLKIDSTKADYEFIYYYLSNSYLELASKANGGAQQNLNAQIIKDFPISLPSLEDQRRIANILSSLDRKIELNNQINKQLEEMAQAIFKSWFVDFEPFKDGEFVDSELGRIPKGWRVGTLDEYCRVFTGRKNTNEAITNGKYPFFSCAPDPLTSDNFLHDGFAVIIAGNGSYTGRTSFYEGRFDLYQRTYACVSNNEEIESQMVFFYHVMKFFFEPTKMGGTRGSSIPYIVMKDITKQRFPYNGQTVDEFSKITLNIFRKIQRLSVESRHLSSLRDTLLPKLMSGEINLE